MKSCMRVVRCCTIATVGSFRNVRIWWESEGLPLAPHKGLPGVNSAPK